MINTKGQTIALTYKNRQVTVLTYFVGLILLAVAALLEQNSQIWQQLTQSVTKQTTISLIVTLILLFCTGLLLTFKAHLRFDDWGYPRASHTNFDRFDERQKTQFLTAQSKAQNFYSLLILLVTFFALFSKQQSYSWMFGLIVLVFASRLLNTLPTALMVWSEPNLQDE